jgi:hypothetical protein
MAIMAPERSVYTDVHAASTSVFHLMPSRSFKVSSKHSPTTGKYSGFAPYSTCLRAKKWISLATSSNRFNFDTMRLTMSINFRDCFWLRFEKWPDRRCCVKQVRIKKITRCLWIEQDHRPGFFYQCNLICC